MCNTYAVEETPVPGYVLEQTGYDLKNTLTVDIPVRKVWRDSENAKGTRPNSVVVALYANGVETARVRLSENDSQLLTSTDKISGESTVWGYTFTGLPQYDENGAFVRYTVQELQVPDGYDMAQSGYTIENVARGALQVEKTVEGAAGDKTRMFQFTVTLADTSVNGAYGDMTFVNGVATFALRHGQSAQATGLPADTAYTVTEHQANADGYVTMQKGESGTIPAGGMAYAVFVNRKDPPGGGAVKTGDGAQPLVYAGLLAASLAGIAGVLARQRKRGKTQK